MIGTRECEYCKRDFDTQGTSNMICDKCDKEAYETVLRRMNRGIVRNSKNRDCGISNHLCLNRG